MGGEGVEVVLTALYLRGGPRPAELPRRGWPQILAALRREGAQELGGVAARLRKAGATLPASLLETAGLLDWAEKVVEHDAVLSVASDAYPRRWLDSFGDSAPPVLWRTGSAGSLEGVRWVGAVGSRDVTPEAESYLEAVAKRAAAIGCGILSGGADGCDTVAERVALQAGAPVLRVLPHGLRFRAEDDSAVQVSLAAPNEPFSRALAMERNALIYGGAELTVVGQVRLRAGGTWHGATEALRRRLGKIVVRPDDSAATRALQALGAGLLKDPADLAFALASAPAQSALFAYEERRCSEPASRYDSPALAA